MRGMAVTAAQWRKLALSMPGAEEKSHFGQPDFRVKNKIFATLSAEEKRGTLKLSPEAQAVLLDARPKAFSPAPGAWGKKGWTFVHLAHAQVKELRSLMIEAWRATAPKKMVAAYDAQASEP